MTTDRNGDVAKFLMRISTVVKDYIFAEIATHYPDKEIIGTIFHNAIINVVANMVHEASSEGKVEENMLSIINGLHEWIKGNNVIYVHYDAKNDKIIKEDIH